MEPAREWPTGAPSIKALTVTLVGLDGSGGLVWATLVGAKRDLLNGTSGPLWAFWKGKYSAHLFVVDRDQAEIEVGSGKAAPVVDENVEKLFAWWVQEAHDQGFATVRVSHAAEEVSAAKLLKTVAKGSKIQAVGQFALTDDRFWRSKVLKVSQLWRQWDRILGDWERAGSPAYEKGWVRE